MIYFKTIKTLHGWKFRLKWVFDCQPTTFKLTNGQKHTNTCSKKCEGEGAHRLEIQKCGRVYWTGKYSEGMRVFQVWTSRSHTDPKAAFLWGDPDPDE